LAVKYLQNIKGVMTVSDYRCSHEAYTVLTSLAAITIIIIVALIRALNKTL